MEPQFWCSMFCNQRMAIWMLASDKSNGFYSYLRHKAPLMFWLQFKNHRFTKSNRRTFAGLCISVSLVSNALPHSHPVSPNSKPPAPLPKAQIWLPFHCSCSWMIMRYGKGKRLAWPYPITIIGCLWAIYQKTGIARISWKNFQNMHVSWACITPTTNWLVIDGLVRLGWTLHVFKKKQTLTLYWQDLMQEDYKWQRSKQNCAL